MHTPGPIPFAVQSESAVQAPQVFVLTAQIGFVGSREQSWLVTHSRQVPFEPQTGCAESRRAHAEEPPSVGPQLVQDLFTQIGVSVGHSWLVWHP